MGLKRAATAGVPSSPSFRSNDHRHQAATTTNHTPSGAHGAPTRTIRSVMLRMSDVSRPSWRRDRTAQTVLPFARHDFECALARTMCGARLREAVSLESLFGLETSRNCWCPVIILRPEQRPSPSGGDDDQSHPIWCRFGSDEDDPLCDAPNF